MATKLKTPIPSLLPHVDSSIRPEQDRFVADFSGLKLSSAFQPIYSLAHQQAVGYEGLLRAYSKDHRPVPPTAIFSRSSSEEESIYLDRLCRGLHLSNAASHFQDKWLFLNITPQTAICGNHSEPSFRQLLESYNFSPHQIVIEVIENNCQDEAMLADAVAYYKYLGCLVAIDDFGAGQSNFERIWRLEPNIVKLDRSMIVRASHDPKVRRLVPRIVSLLHESGSLVLMEGIENEREALIAMDANVDFVQGYFFGRPSEERTHSPFTGFPALRAKYQAGTVLANQPPENRLVLYQEALKQAATLYAQDYKPELIFASLLQKKRVWRCYILDPQGYSLGGVPLASRFRIEQSDPRFNPIANTADINFHRRPYLRRALAQPGQVHTTSPYLSIIDAELCITLSIAVSYRGETHILCCDLEGETSS